VSVARTGAGSQRSGPFLPTPPPTCCRRCCANRDGTSRTSGPLFLSNRKPPPARHPRPRDICSHTGRARLGYDRARVLLKSYTGWRLHQLRHSAATQLGEKKVPLQLIMADGGHEKIPTGGHRNSPLADMSSPH
jgi:integrase